MSAASIDPSAPSTIVAVEVAHVADAEISHLSRGFGVFHPDPQPERSGRVALDPGADILCVGLGDGQRRHRAASRGCGFDVERQRASHGPGIDGRPDRTGEDVMTLPYRLDPPLRRSCRVLREVRRGDGSAQVPKK